MKFDKGIYRDCAPTDQPAGSYRHANNVVYNRKNGAYSTEGGTQSILSTIENSVPIGSAPISADKQVLFYKNTVTGMCYISVFTEPSTITVIRSAVSLGFSTQYPIKAVVIKNQKGEDIVTWVDGKNSPRMLNLNNPGFTDGELELYPYLVNLFPSGKMPILESVSMLEDSGNVRTGTYYFTVAYELDGGGISNYMAIYNPVAVSKYTYAAGIDGIVGSDSDLNSLKSIKLLFTNLDNQYSKMHLAAVKVIDGITTATKIGEYHIPPSKQSMTIIYTGNEFEEDVLVESLLINTSYYSGAKAISYHNRKLYLGNLSKDPFIDWQHYANQIGVKWNFDKTVSVNGVKGSFKDNAISYKFKGFMPDEVYAFYGAFRLKDGGLSTAFHIPGRSALTGDTDLLPAGTDYTQDRIVSANVKKFQTRSTSLIDGTMGYWENEDEKYPEDFPDFKGQNVRHHKFPGIPDLLSWSREYITATSDSPEVQPAFAGARTLTVGSSGGSSQGRFTVQSAQTSPLTFSSFNTTTKQLEINNSGYVDIVMTNISCDSTTPSPGQAGFEMKLVKINTQNVTTVIHAQDPVSVEERIEDMPFMAPIANAFDIFSKTILQVRVDPGDRFEFVGTGYGALQVYNGSISFTFSEAKSLTDYIGTKFAHMLGVEFSNVTIPDEIKDLVQGLEIFYAKRGFENSTVLSQGVILNTVTNKPAALTWANPVWSFAQGMRFYSPDLLANEAPPSINPNYIKIQSEVYRSSGTANVLKNGFTFATPASGTLSEQIIPVESYKYDPQTPDDYRETALSLTVSKTFQGAPGADLIFANLCAYRKNVYEKFYEQELVSTGFIILIEQGIASLPEVIFGGDVYNSDFGFFTNFDNGTPATQLLWSCPMFSVVNASLRKRGEEYGQVIYPTDYNGIDVLNFVGTGTKTHMDNYIWINPDICKLNDLNPAYVDIDRDSNLERFPTRIIESDIQTKEGDSISIRKFSPLNYYEMTKDKGEIVNLESAGQILLIHTTESLFKTMSQVSMKGDTTNIILGNGEIFAVSPEEIMAVPGGYAGTQDQQSCFYSKAGYFFVDRKYGKVFLLNQELKEISNNGLREFFKSNVGSELDAQLIAAGQGALSYPYTNVGQFGFLVTYDEDNYRIVVTKKDIKAKAGFLGDHTYYDTNKYFNYKGSLKKYTGVHIALVLDSPPPEGVSVYIDDHMIDIPANEYINFEEHSFTISYSIVNQAWVSEHDYYPNLLFSTKRNMYGIVGNTLYKHNVDFSPSIYAGVRMPWFIDFVFPTGKDSLLSNVNWQSEYIAASGNTDHFLTLDRALIYNSFQCSGEKIVNSAVGGNTRITRKVWNFNEFRDLVIDNKIPSMVDFQPVLSNIDLYLDWYKQKRFIDKYHIIRLGDSNSRSNVLYLYEIDISARLTFR